VVFRSGFSNLEVQGDGTRKTVNFALDEVDGLYEMKLVPLYPDDARMRTLINIHVTLENDPKLWGQASELSALPETKSPNKLGRWHSKMLWISRKMAPMQSIPAYDDDLRQFCESYLVPPSKATTSRRTYKVTDVDDMSELSLRFMGLGMDRLSHTLDRSRGLTAASNKKGDNVSTVPPHNFPQGRWKSGKVPKVKKNKVQFLQKAAIAEVLFTDTFETDDTQYKYGQAFVDYRSRYGDVQPLKTRKKIGWAFAEFCCRHFKPLILIRDNIAENVSGNLKEECHRLNVKSAFSCPYTPQQNYSEGYLGRVTSMASFAMVFSGAPLFMWRWAILCATFINNISATYYSKEKVWATPYEVMHGEPYPDSSIVVPFGCAALILLEKEDRMKFQSMCALVIFVHYAQDHPLYTYAFFSPRTKRVVFRQDCLFLPEIFPMREARARGGLIPDGEGLVVYRPRSGVSGEDKIKESVSEEDDVFTTWMENDPLPPYLDDITGHQLISPPDDTMHDIGQKSEMLNVRYPSHPLFGPESVVPVSQPASARVTPMIVDTENEIVEDSGEEKSARRSRRTVKTNDLPRKVDTRRPVKDRWFYEPVLSSETSMLTCVPVDEDQCDDSAHEEMIVNLLKATDKYEAALAVQPEAGWPFSSTTGWQKEKEPQVEKNGKQANNKTTTGNFSEKMNLAVPAVPIGISGLDLVEVLPEYLIDAADNEETAWTIQGMIFQDEDVGWCKITGWDVDYGTIFVYYMPVGDKDMAREQHTSLASLLSLIKHVPIMSKLSDYQPSRLLQYFTTRSTQGRVMQLLSVKRKFPVRGTMLARRVTDFCGVVKTLSAKTITRILKAQESLFKFGTFIPKSDREAEQSPEAPRWRSGRTLEWLRLRKANTFETDWTWDRVCTEYPEYKKEDIGHMFYVYDYKYSGEHRVRLVFDGSRQSPTTYSITYAPTVRAESVRMFHLYAVEYGWHIHQYDVPQAFLRSEADCTIFVYPPKGQSDFPGQLLKLAKMLYGSKQAAALWFNLLNTFLTKLGFVASPLDPCFYRRACQDVSDPTMPTSDVIIILHVDDMRVAASPDVLQTIHNLLYAEFQITTSDSGRFLGMDTEYNLATGVFKMHMATYIQSTMDRFQAFDLSNGVPYRELVGSLLWIVLCVMGPELLRVKDLAKRSHKFTMDDYKDAMKALDRIYLLKDFGIVFRRGAAGKEYVPANTRLRGGLDNTAEKPYSIGDETQINDLEENNLYKLHPTLDDQSLDIDKKLAPTNTRFTMVAYSDASFAVGETKQSISGFDIMINGSPILWGSLKQTVVVDSTCSAEYVAASVCCKQILHAENMVQFLEFTCVRPYKMYTDSEACMKIANNASKLGMVRHLEIRYHLVRCIILAGDVVLSYCITEEMLADLFTKVVSSAQDKRLAVRFYNDVDMDLIAGEYLLDFTASSLRK
jgi:hypothetical protein